MGKTFTAIIFLIIGLGFVYVFYQFNANSKYNLFSLGRTATSTVVTTTPSTTTSHLSSDVYPLYTGVTWGGEQQGSLESLSGYGVNSVPVTNVTDLATVFTPFDRYYANKLLGAGWTIDNSRAADGPGSSITAYQKGGKYIFVSHNAVFKGTLPNQPVQCPCDVTLSVFTTE
jgi:hypothetical protein